MKKVANFKSSSSVIQASANVDITSRSITSVIVLERGKIKDSRDFLIDDEFASSMFKAAKAAKGGVISNFGHNWDNLGKRLGRFSNFSDDGTTIRADLSIYEAADASPSLPGLGSYVLQLAQEDPKVIMSSISFSYKYQYQLDSTGNEIKVNYYDKEIGWVKPIKEYGDVRLKFDDLLSIDLVDEGAATNSLFSYQEDTAILDDLIEDATLSQILMQGDKPNIKDAIKTLFGLGSSKHSLTTKSEDVNNDNTPDTATPDTATPETPDTNAAFSKAIEAQNATLSSLTASIEALTKRLDALEVSPAASHTNGNEDATQPAALKAYELNPINQPWMRNRNK